MSAAPIVIAHRGASGYLPEHTIEAKVLAHGFGADFVEQDVVATRDGALVVLHDIHLDDVTDVASRYPNRCRDDGHFYVIDFDLEELRTLRVSERRRSGTREPLFAHRFPPELGRFRIATFAEEIETIQGLNRSTGRDVGLYAEIKHPRWHADHGIDLARSMLETLARHGYSQRDDNVYVQCFDSAELRRARTELDSALKLVQLVDGGVAYRELLTPDGLARVADYAQGLGPAYSQLVTPAEGAIKPRASLLARTAHDAGLLLHPYTFRRDQLPPYADSLEDLLEFFFVEVGVDGVFCDHPDVAVRCALTTGGSPG